MSGSYRSERLRALFHEAMGLDLAERAEYLTEACRDEAELRREVESLLEAEGVGASEVRRVLERLDGPTSEGKHGSPPLGPTGGDDTTAALKVALADRYRIGRELGRGGMATVFLAEDRKHHRQVAVKVLNPGLSQILGTERFLREIETAAKLTHPHILPLHDSGEAGGLLYYVMPYVEGESLRDRLDREKQLPVMDAVRIAREIADALAYAHHHGVVHRDVKPANILLEAGHAVLADFGVAKAVAEAGRTDLTQTGASMGTPTYASPEQSASDGLVDARSDVYSLGCVVYEMLVGQPPYTGATAKAILARKLVEPPPGIRAVRESVPAGLEWAVLKALDRVPADRFQTAAELADALGGRWPDPAWPRRTWSVTRTVTGLGVVVVLGGLAYSALPHRSATDAASPSAGARAPEIAVAILPFENTSPDADAAGWFVEAIREHIAERLGNVIMVRPLESVDRVYDEGATDPAEVAATLRADYLLGASVIAAGTGFRLIVRLVDPRGDSILWQSPYTGDYTTESAILPTLGEMAEQIASALGAELTSEERDRIERQPTANGEAWSLYSRGRVLERRATPETLRRAIELYEQAIQEDPGYGEAYSGLASANLLLGQVERWPHDEYAARGLDAADRAIQVDSTLAGPYRVRAEIKWLAEWDFSGAERDFAKALSLNPNGAWTHVVYAQFLQYVAGMHEEALDHILRAQEIAPTDPFIAANVAFRYLYLGRYRESLEESRKALELEGNHWVALLGTGMAYQRMGRHEEAIEYLELALESADGGLDPLPYLGVAYARAGRNRDAETMIERLLERGATESVPPSWIANIYAGLGDKEMAFEWLEKAYRERDMFLTWMFLETALADELSSDPRYTELRDRIGLTQYAAARARR